jgi:hypothetical protein
MRDDGTAFPSQEITEADLNALLLSKKAMANNSIRKLVVQECIRIRYNAGIQIALYHGKIDEKQGLSLLALWAFEKEDYKGCRRYLGHKCEKAGKNLINAALWICTEDRIKSPQGHFVYLTQASNKMHLRQEAQIAGIMQASKMARRLPSTAPVDPLARVISPSCRPAIVRG